VAQNFRTGYSPTQSERQPSRIVNERFQTVLGNHPLTRANVCTIDRKASSLDA
jgi:hypothetical protein